MRYRTATDHGPGIYIRVRIPYRTVRIRILFGMIRGSGLRPDPESFALSVLMDFFTDPDPRIRIRVCVTPNSFRKKFKHDILEEKRIRATFEWNRVYILHFSFKKNAVPGLRIETLIRTKGRIRASALASVP